VEAETMTKTQGGIKQKKENEKKKVNLLHKMPLKVKHDIRQGKKKKGKGLVADRRWDGFKFQTGGGEHRKERKKYAKKQRCCEKSQGTP